MRGQAVQSLKARPVGGAGWGERELVAAGWRLLINLSTLQTCLHPASRRRDSIALVLFLLVFPNPHRAHVPRIPLRQACAGSFQVLNTL